MDLATEEARETWPKGSDAELLTKEGDSVADKSSKLTEEAEERERSRRTGEEEVRRPSR